MHSIQIKISECDCCNRKNLVFEETEDKILLCKDKIRFLQWSLYLLSTWFNTHTKI